LNLIHWNPWSPLITLGIMRIFGVELLLSVPYFGTFHFQPLEITDRNSLITKTLVTGGRGSITGMG
jgi:hypothetical protein